MLMMSDSHRSLGSQMTVLARWVSILAHPFIMVGILVTVAARRYGPPADATRILLWTTLFTILPLVILMTIQVRRGSWAHVDASHPRERPLLFAVGAIGLLALLACLFVLRPHSILIRGVVGTLAMLATCAVVTRWVKVSLHMAFAALTTTSLMLLGSPIGWALLAVLPLLAWSRLVLGRHRPLEVALGALAGFVSAMAIHSL